MRLAVIMAAAVVAVGLHTNAQVLGVQVRNGDVYVQDSGSLRRLTHDGQNTEAVRSRDGSLIAFVRKEGEQGSSEMNSLFLCIVSARRCDRVVLPREDQKPEDNLTDITSPQFSYQASAQPNGRVVGSIFFLTSAWATSGAIHRVTLGPNSTATFVAAANDYSVVPSGRFAGALQVSQHKYATNGEGSCELNSIMDPNTGKRLALLPSPDCQGMTVR